MIEYSVYSYSLLSLSLSFIADGSVKREEISDIFRFTTASIKPHSIYDWILCHPFVTEQTYPLPPNRTHPFVHPFFHDNCTRWNTIVDWFKMHHDTDGKCYLQKRERDKNEKKTERKWNTRQHITSCLLIMIIVSVITKPFSTFLKSKIMENGGKSKLQKNKMKNRKRLMFIVWGSTNIPKQKQNYNKMSKTNEAKSSDGEET